MRKATAILMSALLAASLAGCDSNKPSSDTWHLTRHGVLLLKAGERDPIHISLPGWLWVGEPYGCGPALAVGPAGEAVVTSDVAPMLWRVDPGTRQVSLHTLALARDNDKDVGFTALSYSSEQNAYIAVSGTYGSLWKIDARLTRAEPIGRPDGRSARVNAVKAEEMLCATN